MKSEVRHNSETIYQLKIPSEYFKTVSQREEGELGLGTSSLKDEQATVCKDKLNENTFCDNHLIDTVFK